MWCFALVGLTRRRWFMVPVFALTLTIIVGIDIGASPHGLRVANQWDILLGIFDGQFIVMVILPLIFWAMIADLITYDTEGFTNLTFVRLRTRATWWWSKIGAIGLEALIYTGVLVCIALLVCIFIVPFSSGWSSLAMHTNWSYSGGLTLEYVHIPPLEIMLKALGLIYLGLFASGVFVAVLGFITKHAFTSWSIGTIMALLSYAARISPRCMMWVPTMQMLLSFHREFNMNVPHSLSLFWSIGYDILLLLTTSLLGYYLALRRNF